MNGEEIMDDLYFSAVNEYTANVDGVSVSIYTRSERDDGGIVSDEVKLMRTLHTHTYAELFVCEEGMLEINTENEPIRLYSGDVAVIAPQCRHTLNQEKGNRTRMMGFGFRINPPQSKGQGLLTRLYNEFFVDRTSRVYPVRHELIRAVTELQRIKRVSDPLVPVMKALLLLDALCESGGRSGLMHADVTENDVTESGGFDRYVVLDEIINSGYRRRIKADDVSARLFLSRRQFDRIVMKRYGKSFLDVINEKRLELSLNYLRTTELTLDDIAERIGSLTKSTFCRLFKMQYGITPNEFRKRCRKEH